MKKTINNLTDRQLKILQGGLILNRETLEKLFSIEFMQKHKNIEYATLVLNGDDGEEYFFTLTENFNSFLCCPDYDPIDTEFMLQDLFKCGIIKDEILVYMVDVKKPRKFRPDYKNSESWVIDSAIMQNNVVTSKEFEDMCNNNEISTDRRYIHIAKEGEK